MMKFNRILAFGVVLSLLFGFGSRAIGSTDPTDHTTSVQSAADLLNRWTDALGGKVRIAKVKAIHRRMSGISRGLPEVVDEWTTWTLKRRVVSDRQKDRSTTVFDGRRGWVVDWNGWRRELESDETRSEVAQALVHGFPSVSSAAGPAILGGTDPATGALIVQFSPPGGDPLTYYLDSKSYLPLRVELTGGVSIAFSDWREVDGVKISFVEQHTDSKETVEYHLDAVQTNFRDGSLFQRPSPGLNDAFILPGTGPSAAPFNFENNHLMVQTSVNGHPPIWFMIDTGAAFTVISQERLGEYGLQPYGGLKTQGGGNNVTGAYVYGVTCRVGLVEVRDQHAAVLSLHGLERVYGMPLGGILGYDFISRFILDVDYAAHTVTFRPLSYRYRGGGSTVPFSLSGNTPYVDGSVTARGKSIPAHFILDVGAADTATLTSPFVDKNDLVALAGDPRQQPRTLAGSEKEFFAPTTIRGLLDEIRLGSLVLPHVYVNLSRGKSGAYASDAFSGTIGQTILQRYHNILDYSRRRLYLEPTAEASVPFTERKSFGLTLLADGPFLKTFTVTAVGANSPAARAGFKKDDVISGVDGVSKWELTLGMLRDLLAKDGRQLTLRVHRDGQDIALPVTVERVPISGLP